MNRTTIETEFGPRLVNLQGSRGLRAAIKSSALVSSDDAPPNTIDFRSSNATLDRYQEIISVDGWKLDNYRKNPVVQNAHSYDSLSDTIGRSLITEVRADYLFQRIQFAVAENPIAQMAYGLYKGGYLSAVSVGFLPIRWDNGSPEAGYRRKYLEQELLEVSAVSIPANPSALALGIKSGAVSKSTLSEAAKLLQHLEKINPPTQASPRQGPSSLLTLLGEIRAQLRKS